MPKHAGSPLEDFCQQQQYSRKEQPWRQVCQALG